LGSGTDGSTGLVKTVEGRVLANRNLGPFCDVLKGGRGRTGMLAAACLVEQGYDSESAIDAVKQHREGALTVKIKCDAVHEYAQKTVEVGGMPVQWQMVVAHEKIGHHL
jgi:hypothetical protein